MSDRFELTGSKVRILSTTEADLPELLELWNDGRVMKWVQFPDGLGWDLERMRKWFAKQDGQVHRGHFIVENEQSGFCGELHYRRVEDTRIYSLDVKFRPESQGRGLATEAFGMLIDHVFAVEPDCDAVYTEPWPENEAAKALYRRCGLRPESRPAVLGEGPSYWERNRS